ncbi:MAG: GTPase HflX [Actinobacteria bacterium]|nr:GTPase HflX [Actinomycetota bacterium]
MSNPYQEALGQTLIERTFRERIVLVGVTLPPHTDEETDASLDELALLVDTAGADAVATLTQRRDSPDPAWYLGKGKAEELKQVCLDVDADTVVFDNELSPAQQYNLEKMLGRTALDRTAVILDIFAQNAHTLEGKAQVELALLRYRLPRLRRGAKGAFSQQGAGIGTRGPGETKLEVDRRRITRKISKLESELRELARTRENQRKGRERSGLSSVTIVGYTNAGKSTLLNRLTESGVLVQDRLFATLDPTTRRLSLPGGEPVLLTDTVGFVRRLPHGLIEAFKSTLEVASQADFLVHVVDASAESSNCSFPTSTARHSQWSIAKAKWCRSATKTAARVSGPASPTRRSVDCATSSVIGQSDTDEHRFCSAAVPVRPTRLPGRARQGDGWRPRRSFHRYSM